MPRRKRSYIPKVKGCHQCSKRRIDCDGTRPSCNKCTSRGIACSGFGVVYRFRSGLPPKRAKRGAVKRFGDLSDAIEAQTTSFDAGFITFSSSSVDESQSSSSPSADNHSETTEESSTSPPPSSCGDIDLIETVTFEGKDQAVTAKAPSRPAPPSCDKQLVRSSPNFGLGCLDLWSEFLLKHFSDYIAPQMVPVDDCNNGWRNLVLPIAYTDQLVLNAIQAVSAFHLCGKDVGSVADPSTLYVRAIQELQRRKDLGDCDLQTRQSVIVAIVVLLVGVMVNGYSDFPAWFNMLQLALDFIGGEDGLSNGVLTDFLKRQIGKIHVYAAPFISQEAGVDAILNAAQKSFDCLNYYHELHPEHTEALTLIANLKQQAYDIYLYRAFAIGTAPSFTDVIDEFKTSIEAFPEGSPGEHVLIWPSFIAASESISPEHREFFKGFLLRQYRRNGFLNILRALELLERIWARDKDDEWPALLPEPGVLIM